MRVDRAVPKQRRQRQSHAERLFDFREQPDGYQRGSAELKEVVVRADLVHGQHALPDGRQPSFDGGRFTPASDERTSRASSSRADTRAPVLRFWSAAGSAISDNRLFRVFEPCCQQRRVVLSETLSGLPVKEVGLVFQNATQAVGGRTQIERQIELREIERDRHASDDEIRESSVVATPSSSPNMA